MEVVQLLSLVLITNKRQILPVTWTIAETLAQADA